MSEPATFEGSFTLHAPELSEWQCYLFGNRPPGGNGIVWRPLKGREPHAFARFMMRVCFDCLWVRDGSPQALPEGEAPQADASVPPQTLSNEGETA